MNAEVRIERAATDQWESEGWMQLPGFLGADELALLSREADRLLELKE